MACIFTRLASAIRAREEEAPVKYDEVLHALARAVGSIFKAEKLLEKWENLGMIFFDDEGEAHV